MVTLYLSGKIVIPVHGHALWGGLHGPVPRHLQDGDQHQRRPQPHHPAPRLRQCLRRRLLIRLRAAGFHAGALQQERTIIFCLVDLCSYSKLVGLANSEINFCAFWGDPSLPGKKKHTLI